LTGPLVVLVAIAHLVHLVRVVRSVVLASVVHVVGGPVGVMGLIARLAWLVVMPVLAFDAASIVDALVFVEGLFIVEFVHFWSLLVGLVSSARAFRVFGLDPLCMDLFELEGVGVEDGSQGEEAREFNGCVSPEEVTFKLLFVISIEIVEFGFDEWRDPSDFAGDALLEHGIEAEL